MKKPNLHLGTILLYLAAAFQATQYARAFRELDATSWWAQAGGLLAGVVVNVGLAYSASRLPRIRSPKARRFSYIAFGTLVIMTPVFLAPINFKTMGDLWAGVPVLRWTLAIIGASVVDVTIALVAFSDSSLIPLTAPQAEGSAPKVRAHKPHHADAVRQECAALSAQYACHEPQCGWSPSVEALYAAAQAGKNVKNSAASSKAGHVKNQHKPIAIDESLLIHKKDKS